MNITFHSLLIGINIQSTKEYYDLNFYGGKTSFVYDGYGEVGNLFGENIIGGEEIYMLFYKTTNKTRAYTHIHKHWEKTHCLISMSQVVVIIIMKTIIHLVIAEYLGLSCGEIYLRIIHA